MKGLLEQTRRPGEAGLTATSCRLCNARAEILLNALGEGSMDGDAERSRYSWHASPPSLTLCRPSPVPEPSLECSAQVQKHHDLGWAFEDSAAVST